MPTEVKIIVLSAALLVIGCAGVQRNSGNYPNGLVKTPEEAIAIAKKECGPKLQDQTGEWRARLDRDMWFAWLTPNAALQISVDARNGKTTGCVVVS
jgi:hypothetical protein